MSRQSWRLCGAWVHGAWRQMHCLLRPSPSSSEAWAKRTRCCRRTWPHWCRYSLQAPCIMVHRFIAILRQSGVAQTCSKIGFLSMRCR